MRLDWGWSAGSFPTKGRKYPVTCHRRVMARLLWPDRVKHSFQWRYADEHLWMGYSRRRPHQVSVLQAKKQETDIKFTQTQQNLDPSCLVSSEHHLNPTACLSPQLNLTECLWFSSQMFCAVCEAVTSAWTRISLLPAAYRVHFCAGRLLCDTWFFLFLNF